MGDFGRCKRVASYLTNVKRTKSKRNFLTFTGLYKGKPVSIVCPGMGIPNTDFLVREAREVVSGPMIMARFGTCGVVDEKVTPGDIMLPKYTALIQQNYDFNPAEDAPEKQFFISKACPADARFHSMLTKKFIEVLGTDAVHNDGLMATAQTFYSGQGRAMKNFKDNTLGLLDIIKKAHPNHTSFEMEMYCV